MIPRHCKVQGWAVHLRKQNLYLWLSDHHLTLLPALSPLFVLFIRLSLHSVSHAGLLLVVLLGQLPECWDYRLELPCSAGSPVSQIASIFLSTTCILIIGLHFLLFPLKGVRTMRGRIVPYLPCCQTTPLNLVIYWRLSQTEALYDLSHSEKALHSHSKVVFSCM